MVWNTDSSSPGELEITCNTSDVAACCSSASKAWRCASASCRRVSSSSRARDSSCPCSRLLELGRWATPCLAFVLVERSLRPSVWLFGPLRGTTNPRGTSTDQALLATLKHITAGSPVSEPRSGGQPVVGRHEQVRRRLLGVIGFYRLRTRKGHVRRCPSRRPVSGVTRTLLFIAPFRRSPACPPSSPG